MQYTSIALELNIFQKKSKNSEKTNISPQTFLKYKYTNH